MRHQQREALERGLGGDVGLAVDDQADVEAGAAHVDADQVRAVAAMRASATPPIVPPTGPESSVCSEPLARRLGGDDAAARLHHVQRHGEPAALHLGLEPLEVAAHDRARCTHRCTADEVRSYSRHSRATRCESETVTLVELLAQDLLRAQLVGRVDVGEEEGDGDRAEALVTRAAGRGADGVLVERRELLAVASRGARRSRRCRERGTSGVGLR